MYTIATVIGIVFVGYAAYQIWKHWPQVNSTSDIEKLFQNYNSVDDLKAAYAKAQADIEAFKTGIQAQVKVAEDKAAALKALIS